MADNQPTIAASDLFTLGGFFIPQNSTLTDENSFAEMVKANGDTEKFSSAFDDITTAVVEYRFNADTGLGAALPNIGDLGNVYHITELVVETSWENYPVIRITGHNHDNNAHIDDRNEYAIPTEIASILTGAQGAYDFSGNAENTVSCIQSSTFTLSADHVDANCNTGEHFVGQLIHARAETVDNYVGISVSVAALSASWRIESFEQSDSNTEFDTSTFTQFRGVSRE